jgi:very-short-patch-repair endonuclease
VRREGRLVDRGPVVPDSEIRKAFARFAFDADGKSPVDLEWHVGDPGVSVAGDGWPDMSAEVAAMAHAAVPSSSPPFEADPFTLASAPRPMNGVPLCAEDIIPRAALESPIERRLLEALLDFTADHVWSAPRPALCRIGKWNLRTQRPTGRWRLDLSLESACGAICVEADGHDYHERTAEQAERDRGRDRTLTALGWTVLRFTGREIWRSARDCATEIAEHMIRLERSAGA